MRPQLQLIIELYHEDVVEGRLHALPPGTRMWHSMSDLPADAIGQAIAAGWLERGAVTRDQALLKDYVRLTDRGAMVARQNRLRMRRTA